MKLKFLILSLLLSGSTVFSQPLTRRLPYDLTKDRVLYTVGYTHLDSEYEWDYRTTVSEYLKNTLEENYRLFEKYPDYLYSFTGSRRYKMMKEYHPALYSRLKGYVDAGRWNVAGSSVEEAEVNISNAESVIRHILYGNGFFKHEFGKTSADYMLPDCFGFVANLPSLLHHAGILGFSTQKLTIPNLNTCVPLPFNVGVWKGPDGKGVVACLDATDYDGDLLPRLDIDPYWDKRLSEDERKYGIRFDYRYYGCGDMGGGLRDRDVTYAEESLHNPDSKIRVVLASSDQMFRDITPAIEAKLPVYQGDLLLVEHSSGSMTSASYMKRLNRKNELLAQTAEQMAVMAGWINGSPYPLETLNKSWELLLGSQMHDVLPGTAIPSGYPLAWNDEFVAQNGFASVFTRALGEVTSQMHIAAKGRALAVYNPVARDREDVCTAEMEFPEPTEHLRVTDAQGKELPAQILSRKGNNITFLFLAKVPSMGIALFDVTASAKRGNKMDTGLSIEPNSLENEYYRVTLDDNGDIRQILDKKSGRLLLSAPSRLAFLHESPRKEPAWNMFWSDRKNPPFAYMDKEPVIRMVENGPVRVAFEVTRKGENSIIRQTLSLAAGQAGKRIEVDNKIDWQSTGVSLKATFPLTAENENATYNLGVGTIQRNTNHENKFEVPSKYWFDLTDKSGKFGVSILEDCKYGSDKPDDKTLRLTLMYTPSANLCPTWLYQASQDWGIQQFKYGLYSHDGDWSTSETQRQAEFLNRPLLACEVSNHNEKGSSSQSFIRFNSEKVGIMALKKAEESDHLIIRVNELSGKDQHGILLSLPGKITDAYEVNGQEQKIGEIRPKNNQLEFDLTGSSLRSFAIKLDPLAKTSVVQSQVALPYDQDVMSHDDNRTDGDMVRKYDPTDHGHVYNYPAEMVPDTIRFGGIAFQMGSRDDLKKNCVTCQGQTLQLPAGPFRKLSLLVAATEETTGNFGLNGKVQPLQIGKWTGFIGQHYDRVFDLDGHTVVGMKAPYLKKDNIAWFASHVHFGYPTRNEPYQYCYLFRYDLELPEHCTSLQLPDNSRIKIFAITLSDQQTDDIRLLQPLADDFSQNEPFHLRKP
ncbi:MAG: glycosyl hydrolase-related protein [Marinilabiliales bacterium]|nr:glycosyl hydrolase-related protein [Marinilabiliales bacterium]